MSQPQRLFAFILLITSVVGCGQTTPQSPVSPSISPSAEVSPTPQASASPEPSISPTITDTSTVSLKKIQGEGVELSIPNNFEGGNPSKEIDTLSQKLKKVSPEAEAGLEKIKQNPSVFALIAFDPQISSTKFLTNINIRQVQAPPGLTIEEALEALNKELTNPSNQTSYSVLDSKVESVKSYKAARILGEPKNTPIPLRQLIYTIKDGDRLWLVTYSTPANEYEQRLPGFEKSIQTFTVKS